MSDTKSRDRKGVERICIDGSLLVRNSLLNLIVQTQQVDELAISFVVRGYGEESWATA